jgi:hypothetical protein
MGIKIVSTFICDRCGAEAESTMANPNHWASFRVAVTQRGNNLERMELELCPSCVKAFKGFLGKD